MLIREKVKRIRCAPKSAPCPKCGRRGRRKRVLHRRLRTAAYRQVAWIDVTYAEYLARCSCCKYFRTWPLDVPPKALYDRTLRQAILDRLLRDRLNIQQTIEAMQRDFLIKPSEGFIYDCLREQVKHLDLSVHRQHVLEHFSGTLCVDEIHLGSYTLLLATDPLADMPVAFALVSANDEQHMGRFLRNLAAWGLQPEVVISDGSSLYPELLATIWPGARHQLCVFHVLQDVLDKVLDAVRRLRRKQERRGKAGRKRGRGRPSARARARRERSGPSNREKAKFIGRHRFLIVKRTNRLDREDWANLVQMFAYLPELKPLWHFCGEIYRLLDDSKTLKVARWRYTLLKQDPRFQEVRELVEAMDLLAEPKLTKVMAFVKTPKRKRQRTNNHVERMNRRLRFAEKVRYRWRKRRWVVRWVVLLLDVSWKDAEAREEAKRKPQSRTKRTEPQQRLEGRRKAA